MDELTYKVRELPCSFETRADGDDLFIEGYFAVFNSEYQIFDDAVEMIKQGAFSETLDRDIRALIDHETRLVLGRTSAGTLELKEDDHGLWGRIKINPNDVDAMNLYERVKRGDVNQCSFGFDILEEDFVDLGEGKAKWIIEKVRLYEVSVVTFPAYTETAVVARKNELAEINKRKAQLWRERAMAKLKGEKNA